MGTIQADFEKQVNNLLVLSSRKGIGVQFTLVNSNLCILKMIQFMYFQNYSIEMQCVDEKNQFKFNAIL